MTLTLRSDRDLASVAVSVRDVYVEAHTVRARPGGGYAAFAFSIANRFRVAP